MSSLQFFILFVSIGAIVAVEALIAARTLKARLAPGRSDVAEPRALELAWTVLPAVLLALLIGYGIANLPSLAN